MAGKSGTKDLLRGGAYIEMNPSRQNNKHVADNHENGSNGDNVASGMGGGNDDNGRNGGGGENDDNERIASVLSFII